METETVIPLNVAFEARKQELREMEARLKSGDGGGISGGMEARVAKLESDVCHLVKQVDRIDARTENMPADIAVIKATMATKGFIVTALGITLALTVSALTILSKLGILSSG